MRQEALAGEVAGQGMYRSPAPPNHPGKSEWPEAPEVEGEAPAGEAVGPAAPLLRN